MFLRIRVSFFGNGKERKNFFSIEDISLEDLFQQKFTEVLWQQEEQYEFSEAFFVDKSSYFLGSKLVMKICDNYEHIGYFIIKYSLDDIIFFINGSQNRIIYLSIIFSFVIISLFFLIVKVNIIKPIEIFDEITENIAIRLFNIKNINFILMK